MSWLRKPIAVATSAKKKLLLDQIVKELAAAEEEFKSKNESLIDGFPVLIERALEAIAISSNSLEEIVQGECGPRAYTLALLGKLTGDLLETGEYHLTRGMINPMGPGNDLLRIHCKVMRQIVEEGYLTEQAAEEEIAMLKENIRSIG